MTEHDHVGETPKPIVGALDGSQRVSPADPRLAEAWLAIEVIQCGPESARQLAGVFAATKPGAALLADAAAGRKWRESIERGLADMEAGRTTPWADVKAEMKRRDADAAVGRAMRRLPEHWTLAGRDGLFALDIHEPGIEVDVGVGVMHGPPEAIAAGTGATIPEAIAKALGDKR